MSRKALHAADGKLLAHGFSDFVPGAGEFVRDVPDVFNVEPGKNRWDGANYVPVVLTADQMAGAASDAIDRLQFDVMFTAENNMREVRSWINVLRPGTFTAAQAAQITAAQYRNALIARWKALNP